MDENDQGLVQFRKLENINTQCMSFLTFNAGGQIKDKLLIGTIIGLFEITGGGKGTFLDESVLDNPQGRKYYIFKLYNSPGDPARIYLGMNTGLVTLVYEKGGFKQVSEEQYQNEIRSIAEGEKGDLWLGTSIKGVIKLGFLPSGYTIITKYTTDDGLPSMDRIFIYRFNEKIYFTTPKGIYRLNEETNKFFPDSTFGTQFADGSIEVFRMSIDKDSDLWMSYDKDNRWYETFVSWKDGKYVEFNLPFYRLPTEKLLNEELPQHFILFKPRDIVRGDFYWMTKIDNKVCVVAADYTGHGVPGAFMSMLGISFLNEIVNNLKIIQSNQILDELRKHIMESLKQTGEAEDETKDGMDMALCVIDKDHEKIQYSGAYIPLYIVRPLTAEEKNTIKKGEKLELPRGALHNNKYLLNQVNADKMPIGISAKNLEPFTHNELDLKHGYSIYLFSDGYVDQFEGLLVRSL